MLYTIMVIILFVVWALFIAWLSEITGDYDSAMFLFCAAIGVIYLLYKIASMPTAPDTQTTPSPKPTEKNVEEEKIIPVVHEKQKSSQPKKEISSNKQLPQTLRFDYYDVVKENGGLTIKKFVGVDKPTLTVPAELGGIRVLEIDTGAFRDCKYIENVTISEGILAIRNGAFADCQNLRSVVLPSTLKSFGNDSELKQSTSQQAVFHNCRLQSIEMPPAIINIGERAFYNCDLLKDIMLPDGLEVIGDEAFWGCTSLSKVHIPKSVQTIGKDAFKTKGEGNRKRNLNITLYCYGGSAGLEYARANNLAYKDAEELE